MSNSPLVVYTKLSPNCSKRIHPITKITIHHAASTGSIESMGNYFAMSSAGCSANYGVGNDGRVAMYVPEDKRAWTSSNADNDNRAITIEVANSARGGNWLVSDAALNATINLCVDICKRNNIKSLNFTGDKNGNLTMHCYFAPTACPGPYLKSKFPYIADEVNKRLGVTNVKEETKYNSFKVGDMVKLTGGATYYNGDLIPSWLFKQNLYVREINGNRVVISTLKSGAITGTVDIEDLTLVSAAVNSAPVVNKALNIGDTVKLTPGATYYDGKSIPVWVAKKKLYVRDINGDNVTISWLKTGAITGVVNKKNLVKC